MEKELDPMKEKLQSDRRSTRKYDEKVDEWKVLTLKSGVKTTSRHYISFLVLSCFFNFTVCLSVFTQNKVEEAERKYKQIQEQLEGITQQVQELQPKCAELKTETQRRNNLLKSSEVRSLRCNIFI